MEIKGLWEKNKPNTSIFISAQEVLESLPECSVEAFAEQTVGAASVSDFIYCEPDLSLTPGSHLVYFQGLWFYPRWGFGSSSGQLAVKLSL